MYKDIDTFVSGCPECATVSGGRKVRTPISETNFSMEFSGHIVILPITPLGKSPPSYCSVLTNVLLLKQH